jgi:divalent metal cation (Fe/Co/Zn/Cd) transporter
VRERVLLAAAREGLPIHHVTIHHLGDRLSVSLDLEVDGEMPLGDAHEVATALETAIRAEIGSDVEVETHLEPLLPDLLPGAPLANGISHQIHAALDLAADRNGVSDVHNVRIRELGDGLFVAFHCRFDPSLPAREVHARADALERAVRAAFPAIRRIVSHPEPIRAAAA